MALSQISILALALDFFARNIENQIGTMIYFHKLSILF